MHAPKSGIGVKIAAVVAAGAVAGGTFVAVKAFTGKNTSATKPVARASAGASNGGSSSAPPATTAPPTTPVVVAQPASIRFARNNTGANVVFQAASCAGPSGAWKGTEAISGSVHGTIAFQWDFGGGTSAPLTATGKISFPQGAITFSGNSFSGSTGQGVSLHGSL